MTIEWGPPGHLADDASPSVTPPYLHAPQGSVGATRQPSTGLGWHDQVGVRGCPSGGEENYPTTIRWNRGVSPHHQWRHNSPFPLGIIPLPPQEQRASIDLSPHYPLASEGVKCYNCFRQQQPNTAIGGPQSWNTPNYPNITPTQPRDRRKIGYPSRNVSFQGAPRQARQGGSAVETTQRPWVW